MDGIISAVTIIPIILTGIIILKYDNPQQPNNNMSIGKYILEFVYHMYLYFLKNNMFSASPINLINILNNTNNSVYNNTFFVIILLKK